MASENRDARDTQRQAKQLDEPTKLDISQISLSGTKPAGAAPRVGTFAGALPEGVTVMVSGKRYQVYSIRETKEKDGRSTAVWVKSGSAWVNRDSSINVYLDVLPLDGKLHIREAVDRKQLSDQSDDQQIEAELHMTSVVAS